MKKPAKTSIVLILALSALVGFAHLMGYVGYGQIKAGDQYAEKWAQINNPFDPPSTVTVTAVSNGYVQYYWNVPTVLWSKSEPDFHFAFKKAK